jgi:mannan endo-1,4-beta-mannosidase
MITSSWLSLLTAAAVPTLISARPHDSQPTQNSPEIAADDFVSVNSFKLKDRQGTVYLTGLNYWSCMNLAADDHVGGNHSRFITELDQMQAHGVNHLRIMASSEGAPTHQPFRMYPALMEAPGAYNEAIFVGLDRCLNEMSKRGMRATMTLANEWQWSGGFAQYVSWATNNSQIPYPSSWNLTAAPQRSEPGTGWGNYTVEGVDADSYGNFTAYANYFYTIPKCQEWYHAHISKVLNRVNTVNGRIYKEDATVMTWQLANEPQPAVVPTEYLGPYSRTARRARRPLHSMGSDHQRLHQIPSSQSTHQRRLRGQAREMVLPSRSQLLHRRLRHHSLLGTKLGCV